MEDAKWELQGQYVDISVRCDGQMSGVRILFGGVDGRMSLVLRGDPRGSMDSGRSISQVWEMMQGRSAV